jgi:hypothetical protein
MSETKESTILEQLTAAVAARKDSLIALRARIESLIEPIPVGVTLADDEGVIGKIKRICTGASQWSNRTWDVTIQGKGLIADGGFLVADICDRSYWDGNNMHHHSTEGFYLGSDSEGSSLCWLSGKETRKIALRLPRAIERYIEECKAETAANSSTAV